jgi:DNA topoisomerase-1
MPKKYTTTISLVIVESPAKCKKIEEYLGPGYKCIASFGHLRELTSLKNINIADNFNTTYTIIDNALKKKQIELIKKEIASAGEVILATDDDREGEAIAWHICELFNLNIQTTKRIIFHEITETALQNAIKNPTHINMDIVQSQQARQILDLLIGFKVSSNLRNCILQSKTGSLSAGRCQTPALKIIYDNYNEIKNSTALKTYNTSGYFTNQNIVFNLTPENKYETEEQIIDYLSGASDYEHIFNCSEPKQVFKKQPEPFTTSKIQQTASTNLHLSPKETMSICQKLYEAGYITYMRTDSKTYSREFIDSTKEYITRNYADGTKYINDDIDLFVMNREKNDNTNTNTNTNKSKTKNKTKDKNNNLRQEAHEAIRPTDINVKNIPDSFSSKEKHLYNLIWVNTLESCMSKAKFYSITAKIESYDETVFTYTSEIVDFPGWMIVTKKYSSDNKEYHYLMTMKKNSIISFKKIIANVSVKNIKSHYTEAKLVQILEEYGIGRPSTFSGIVDKIQEREYVKKEDVKGIKVFCKDYILEDDEIEEIETSREFGNEKNKLVIQPIGILVIDFLNKHFNTLFEYNYTKQMEELLDNISKGETEWRELCKNCNDEIDLLISNGKNDKLEIKIDDNNSYVVGKYGPVIKCNETINDKEVITFKPVKKDLDIHALEKGEYIIDEIVDADKMKNKTANPMQHILGKYEEQDVILKKGKYGLYITWGNNTKPLKELGNRPIESITYKDVEKYLSEGSNIIRNISDNITIRKGEKGDYIFFKTKKMKKPSFYSLKDFKNNYKDCKLDELKMWLKTVHGIF